MVIRLAWENTEAILPARYLCVAAFSVFSVLRLALVYSLRICVVIPYFLLIVAAVN